MLGLAQVSLQRVQQLWVLNLWTFQVPSQVVVLICVSILDSAVFVRFRRRMAIFLRAGQRFVRFRVGRTTIISWLSLRSWRRLALVRGSQGQEGFFYWLLHLDRNFWRMQRCVSPHSFNFYLRRRPWDFRLHRLSKVPVRRGRLWDICDSASMRRFRSLRPIWSIVL